MKENARFKVVYLPVVSDSKGITDHKGQDKGSNGERITRLWRQIELKQDMNIVMKQVYDKTREYN